MANFDLLVLESGHQKRRPSNAQTIDFTALRVGASTMALTESSGNWAFDSRQLKNVADPTAAQDAATKFYVDAVASGLDVKQSMRAATTAALAASTYNNGTSGVGATLTANANGAFPAQDGVTLVVSDRLLVKNQASGLQNGLYTLSDAGSAGTPWILTRATDADQNAEVTAGLFGFIEEGSVNADSGWVLTTDNPITIGTTALSFTQFSGAGSVTAGAGLTKTGNTIDVIAGDASLDVQADSVAVKRDGAGAIGLSGSGVKVNVDNSTIDISSNNIEVKSAGITSTQLATDSVSTIKIADLNVTTAKINDLAVTTGKLAATSVTAAKLGSDVAGTALTGGNGSAISVDFTRTLTNDNAGAITVGQVVYVKSNGHVDLASASTSSLFDAELGIVQDSSISASGTGKIIFRRGAIVAGFTSLTPGKREYVDPSTAGNVTETLASFTAGQEVYSVGRALSATEVIFDPRFEFEY